MRKHWRRAAHFTVALSLLTFGLSGTPSSAQDPSSVRINEVESSDGSPGDWVELVNTGSAAVDVSGWVVKDNDDSHSYTISSGTSLAPGAFLALDVESSYGLGSPDSARLFQGSTLIDSYTWTDHADTTYGRCPDGTGGFTTTVAPTKGAANSCGGGQPSNGAWPGDSAVTTADGSNVFGENLSGLSFESPSVLWAVKNGPGTLYRLVPNGAQWSPDTLGRQVSPALREAAAATRTPKAWSSPPTGYSPRPNATTTTATPAALRSCASTPPPAPPH